MFDKHRWSDPSFVQDKRTPLHWAAAGENLSIVQLLLTYEPEVDAKDESGWTPLMIAGEFPELSPSFPARGFTKLISTRSSTQYRLDNLMWYIRWWKLDPR